MSALITVWSVLFLASGEPRDIYALRDSVKDAKSGQEIVGILGEPSSKHPIITCPRPMPRADGKKLPKVEGHECWTFRAENGELTITVGKDTDTVCNRLVRLTKEEFLKRVRVGMTIPQANAALDGASTFGPFMKPSGKKWVPTGIWVAPLVMRAAFEAKADPKTQKIVSLTFRPGKT